MEIHRKKVLLIPLEGVLTDGEDIADFRIRRDILDRIRQMSISRVAIIYGDSDDKDYNVKVKSVEFFVFSYCVVAVSSHKRTDNIVETIMEDIPHSMRKKDLFVSIGEKYAGIDFMTLEDFV